MTDTATLEKLDQEETQVRESVESLIKRKKQLAEQDFFEHRDALKQLNAEIHELELTLQDLETAKEAARERIRDQEARQAIERHRTFIGGMEALTEAEGKALQETRNAAKALGTVWARWLSVRTKIAQGMQRIGAEPALLTFLTTEPLRLVAEHLPEVEKHLDVPLTSLTGVRLPAPQSLKESGAVAMIQHLAWEPAVLEHLFGADTAARMVRLVDQGNKASRADGDVGKQQKRRNKNA